MTVGWPRGEPDVPVTDPRWQTVRRSLISHSEARAALDALEADWNKLRAFDEVTAMTEIAIRDGRIDELKAEMGEFKRNWLNAADLLEKAEAERDEYRFWNERVRVCSQHTSEIADGSTDCLACEVERLREHIRHALNDDVPWADVPEILRAALGGEE